MACYLVCQLQMVAHLFAWASKVKALEEEFIYSLLELPEKNNVSLIAFGGCSMVGKGIFQPLQPGKWSLKTLVTHYLCNSLPSIGKFQAWYFLLFLFRYFPMGCCC